MPYMVTTEDADGMEFGEPVTFETEAEAREWAASRLDLLVKGEGVNYVLYRTSFLDQITDN